jgi:DNA-binding NarL/FixJ family response regulator
VSETQARVVLVDDHPVFRAGLAVALRRDPNLEVVAEAGDGESALELASRLTIDIAVIDLLLPGMSGISLAYELFGIQPGCKILGLSVIDDPGLIADMLRAHASGFALKTQPPEQLIDAIHQVLGGVRYLPPSVSHEAVAAELARTDNDPLQRLTRREREVFELLIRGHTNDEIATRLAISRRTAETHRQRITRKLSARSIAQLQRIAARHGGLGS